MCLRIKFGKHQRPGRTNLFKSLYHTVQPDKNVMNGVRLDTVKVGNELRGGQEADELLGLFSF
jgi:hypothetical protein